jgi:hypothetical protein
MNLNKLIEVLDGHKEAALHILLPSGEHVPEHFHVTEVGRVQKDFIDCGGIVRKQVTCLLQAWYATDVEHRLVAGKLSKILKLGEKVLDRTDLSVEVEYGFEIASHYALVDVQVTEVGLVFILEGKKTDCLAPDKCGVKVVSKNCGTGCC